MNEKIFNIIREKTINNYSTWKLQRKRVISEIGPILLQNSESDVFNFFKKMENELIEKCQENKLQLLLVISVLHFFRRSFDQVIKLFSVLQVAIMSKDRDICRASTTCLRFLVEESSENHTFLREALESAKKVLSPKQKNGLIFNGLMILREVGRFLPEDVFSVTCNHFPEIMNAGCSKDVLLRKIAVKVIIIHVSHVPSNIQLGYATSLLVESNSKLSKIDDLTHGLILICKSVYKLFINHSGVFKDEKISQLVDKLVSFTKYNNFELSSEIYDFIILISKNKKYLFNETLISNLFMYIMSHIIKCEGLPMLIAMLYKFLEIFQGSKGVPLQSIIETIECILPKHLFYPYCNKLFKVLVKIFELYPYSNVSISLFLSSPLCSNYLRAIKIKTNYLTDIREKLLEEFNKGIQPKAELNYQINSIQMISILGDLLFTISSSLFKAISHFCYSLNDKIRYLMIQVLPIFENAEASNELIRMVTTDECKKIRIAGLNYIKPQHLCSMPDSLIQFLADSSYKVRRTAIPLIANVANSLSVYTIPIVMVFINNFLVSVVTHSNPKISSKGCSLLPLIAKYMSNFSPQIIPTITWICLCFLSKNTKLPEIDHSIQIEDYHPIDLNNVIHRTFTTDISLSFQTTFEKNSLKTKIFNVVNEQWFEKRDKYLFETLENLAANLIPFLLQVIPVFINYFKEKRSNALYLSSLNGLIEIVIKANGKINFVKIFPDFLQTLFHILSTETICQDVAIVLLKLIGVIGISKYTCLNIIRSEYDNSSKNNISMKSSSFFTDSVLKLLCNMLKEPSPSVFEAITCIFVNETFLSLPYLETVINAFAKSLNKDEKSNLLFQQLELICIHCGSHIVPYVHLMSDALLNNITNYYCLNVCKVLSQNLKSLFIEYSNKLYPICLNLINNSEAQYLKNLLQFVVFSILYQNQNVEFFIEKIELFFQYQYNEVKTSFILGSLSLLFQSIPMKMYSARISILCFKLLKYHNLNEFCQLIYNICIYGNFPINMIEMKLKNNNIIIPDFQELKIAISKGEKIENLPFVKKLNNKLSDKHLSNVLSSFIHVPQSPFKELQTPVFNNARQWLDNLSYQVVFNSPLISIRGCSHAIMQSQSFRQELFQIAFLSCWRVANQKEKEEFSNIIKLIIQFEQIDPNVISLIELVDNVGMPMMIPDNVIAKACHSSPISLYYFQRYLRDTCCDEDTILELLKLNSKMGRIDSARGLLSSIPNKVKQIDKGKWSIQLGEWGKALEIFEAQDSPNLSNLIECYGNLQLWDNIQKLKPQFENMSIDEKINNSIWYAWSEFHANNLENAKYYMKFFPDENNLDIILFNCIFLIASKQYEEAELSISNGYKVLAQNLSVFNGNDNKETSKRLKFAQHLRELQEALEMKKSGKNETLEVWENRILNYSHESESWMKLIEICSLVLSPETHSRTYLKAFSVLRKERKWQLIDAYWKRFFATNYSITVILDKLKILWSRGFKQKALSSLITLNEFIRAKTPEDFINSQKKESSDLISILFDIINVPIDKNRNYIQNFEYLKKLIHKTGLNDQMRARFLRIQAGWQYQLYKSSISSKNTLIDITKCFEESISIVSNDYKSWAGYAFASSRALSHFEKLRSNFAINAISGFLKATQLRPSESLEYLCQMFSIIFRYGEKIELPQSIKNDIISLPASIIILIIPQIVVHIAHKAINVRELVQNIINVFGTIHFQAVVFALNVLSLLNESNFSQIAKEMMDSLGSKHPIVYEEAKLLIDGLNRSAITWLEDWLGAIDTASRSRQSGDNKKIIDLLQKEFDKINNPICEDDHDFIKRFSLNIQKSKTLFNRFKEGDLSVSTTMWESFRCFFNNMESRLRKLEYIKLNKFSENLAKKRKFSLAVPGTYDVDLSYPYLDRIEDTLTILNSQQHPRCIYMYDQKGIKWKFLLKGDEDLRVDQRIMKFFGLINTLLKTNRNTIDLNVSILKYSITPLTPNTGLISWVTGADTFQQLVYNYRSNRDIRNTIDIDIATQFCGNINLLSAMQKYEVFDLVKSQTKANEIREMLWLRAPAPSIWLERNQNFTISTALMSMAGYVIGLGDRHPSNIMVQNHTGRVVHIDFGDSFEVTMKRKGFPERVPFRMTRMIVNALDGGCVSGLFRRSCEDILWVLRDNQSSIIAQLEVFVHEPIFHAHDSGTVNGNSQKGILERIACKLSGADPIKEGEPKVEYDVSQQVGILVSIASDPHEYVRHYVGWCPFW